MNVTEIKTLLEKEVPVILRDSPDFRTGLQNFIRRQTVSPESFDERFDRILREMTRDRQEQHRQREAQNRKCTYYANPRWWIPRPCTWEWKCLPARKTST